MLKGNHFTFANDIPNHSHTIGNRQIYETFAKIYCCFLCSLLIRTRGTASHYATLSNCFQRLFYSCSILIRFIFMSRMLSKHVELHLLCFACKYYLIEVIYSYSHYLELVSKSSVLCLLVFGQGCVCLLL